jgi:hypothetical protein
MIGSFSKEKWDIEEVLKTVREFCRFLSRVNEVE